MKNVSKKKLSLYRRVTYQIKVPGSIDHDWSNWDLEVRISFDLDEDGLPLSTLTGKFAQAALQGLLRRLYSLGIPLISVNWVGD